MRKNDWPDDWDHLIRRERAASHAVESERLALKSDIAAERYVLSLRHLARLLRKEFNPDQLRDEQGRWTDAGGADALDGADLVLTAGPGAGSNRPINLIEEDALGGHAYRDHVGKSDEYLKARVRNERYVSLFVTAGIEQAGSFESLEAANRYANETVKRNSTLIDDFVAGRLVPNRPTKAFKADFNEITGYEAYAINKEGDSLMRGTTKAMVVL